MAEPVSTNEVLGTFRQQVIYQHGMRRHPPSFPVSFDDLEARAKEAMSPEAWAYIAGGAGGGDTMRANLEAFRRWRIIPRMLRDVTQRTLSVELFGQRLPAPVLMAPIGVQTLVHPQGELMAAKAARAVGIPYIHSTAASSSIEQAAEANGDGLRWYQLYWSRNPELSKSFMDRAERAGYSAIIVTLDTPLLGWREPDLRTGYLPFLFAEGIANYLTDPVFRKALPQPPEQNIEAAVRYFLGVFSHAGYTWKDLAELRKQTRLPMLVKGILSGEDAASAIAAGVDGVIVSNHGGRQVEGAIGALDALPEVVRVVDGRVPVLFDSGIRRGSDAIKALALGARAVLLGRPYMYGLALAGEEGVKEVFRNFFADLDLNLGLAGHASVTELSPTDVIRI